MNKEKIKYQEEIKSLNRIIYFISILSIIFIIATGVIITCLFILDEKTQTNNGLITIDKCHKLINFYLIKSGLNQTTIDNFGISIYADYHNKLNEIKK